MECVTSPRWRYKKITAGHDSQGCARDWYIKFYIVLEGVAQKIIEQIQVEMINEFKELKSKSQWITEIK